MKNKYLILIFLAILTLTNCKKDKKSSSNTLITKTWKRGMIDKNASTNPTNPNGLIKGEITYYPVQNCEKDDTFKFDVDGNLTFKRNAEKCDPNELESEIQSYSIDRINKELTINGTKYVLAEESNEQIKYYTILPSYNEPKYLVFLLQ